MVLKTLNKELTIQTHFFLGQNPLGFHRTAYVQWGHAALPGRPPIVCVHGLTRNGRDFDWLAASLQTDAPLYCPDIVGRGKSDNLLDASLYTYPQYAADLTALIARIGTEQIDWIGTSMGGILGMMLASQPQTPIRRLVINDVGPFIPQTALKRIGDYVGIPMEFADLDQLERYIRTIYAPFGITRDEDWKKLAKHSIRELSNGKLTLAHDIGIAKNVRSADKDAEFWNIYDRITCPTLVIHGEHSDILSKETADQMTTRGPRAKLVTFPKIGHAPALIDAAQIGVIRDFLR